MLGSLVGYTLGLTTLTLALPLQSLRAAIESCLLSEWCLPTGTRSPARCRARAVRPHCAFALRFHDSL